MLKYVWWSLLTSMHWWVAQLQVKKRLPRKPQRQLVVVEPKKAAEGTEAAAEKSKSGEKTSAKADKDDAAPREAIYLQEKIWRQRIMD